MGNALLLALALAAQAPSGAPAATPPSDDYGYVAWCYGALGGYLDLYDQVMPEVTRIEKAFPGPGGVAAALKTYPEMRAQARADLKTYTAAITAAEKASPRPISEYGGASIKKGRSVWTGADAANKARLAQVWMSWSPPGDCETRAKALEKRSNVLGRALIYNAPKPQDSAPEPVPTPAPQTPEPVEQAAPPPATVTPPPEPALVEKPVALPVAKPVAKPPAPKPAQKPAAAVQTRPPAVQPAPAKTEVVIDPFDPKPCAGRLEPAKRGGKTVLICKPD